MLIKYSAEPTAAKFHASKKVVKGFRGCIGNGKSVTCIMEMFRIAKEQWPNAYGVRKTRWAIIRNTYPELKTTTLNTWKQWFPERISPIVQNPIIYTKIVQPIKNDGTSMEMDVYFLSLDKDSDVKKLLGIEVTGIFCNEARELPYSIIKAARERIGRYPSQIDGYQDMTLPNGTGYKCPRDENGEPKPCRRKVLLMDTNPPDTDHWWYQLAEVGHLKKSKNKQVDIKETDRIFDFFCGPSPLIKHDDGTYTPNPGAENIKHLDGGYQYYLDMIAGNTEDHINVQVMGNYGAIKSGKSVYPEYNDNVHLFDGVMMPIEGLPICLGWDFGLTPSCIIGQLTDTGQCRIIAELQAEDMGVYQFARDVVKPFIQNKLSDYYIGFSLGDGSGNNRGEGIGASAIKILNDDYIDDPDVPITEPLDMGFTTEAAPTNDITRRTDSVRSFLIKLTGAGEPGFVLAKRCAIIRKGFNTGYVYKRVQVMGSEDKFRDTPNKNQFSHSHDALQYLCLGFRGGLVRDISDMMPDYEDEQVSVGDW